MSGVTSCTTFLFCRILYQIIEIETMKAGDLMIDIDKYRNWILSHKIEDGKIQLNGKNILIETKFARGEVNFYQLEVTIVEMSVTNISDDENKFYLHFELKDLNHAEELFGEMLETLESLKSQQKLKILLCCTSGLTTNFFKDKLNEAAQLLSLNYEFNAVSFSKLYSNAFDYSIILLAPQIAFQYESVKKTLADKLVLKIPTKAFASYDSSAIVELIRNELEKWKNTAEERAILKAIGEIKNESKILSIAVMPFAHQTRIAYRIYERGEVIKSETVIKGKLNVIRDVEDILDTISHRCEKFDAVGIAIPGSIHNGRVDLDDRMIDPKINFKSLLEEKYNVPVIIHNNLRGAVLGFYAQQAKYKNIIFMSQPRGYLIGGQSILIDGKVISGSHNNAGEVKYLLYSHIEKDEWREHLCDDVDRILDIICFEIRAGICIADPELICIRSEMTPNLDAIKEKLTEYVPEEYLPDFVYIRDSEMAEYILLGEMILCLEALEK